MTMGPHSNKPMSFPYTSHTTGVSFGNGITRLLEEAVILGGPGPNFHKQRKTEIDPRTPAVDQPNHNYEALPRTWGPRCVRLQSWLSYFYLG